MNQGNQTGETKTPENQTQKQTTEQNQENLQKLGGELKEDEVVELGDLGAKNEKTDEKVTQNQEEIKEELLPKANEAIDDIGKLAELPQNFEERGKKVMEAKETELEVFKERGRKVMEEEVAKLKALQTLRELKPDEQKMLEEYESQLKGEESKESTSAEATADRPIATETDKKEEKETKETQEEDKKFDELLEKLLKEFKSEIEELEKEYNQPNSTNEITKKKILLVEDDENVRMILKLMDKTSEKTSETTAPGEVKEETKESKAPKSAEEVTGETQVVAETTGTNQE